MNKKSLVAVATALTAAIAILFAQMQVAKADVDVKQLKLGDAAPQLHIADWVQGDPLKVTNNESNRVRVIEFWATWCPPCRESIPHLSALYKKFHDKGLDIVAITDEEPDHVKSFVKDQGDKMVYPVAVDKDSQTAVAYMLGFNQQYIPYAFVVDTKDNIVWHGFPLDSGLETAIEKNLPKRNADETASKPVDQGA